MTVSGSITKDGLPKSNVDRCGVCSLRVNAKSALCVQCGKWIHIRCEKGDYKDLRNFTCIKCEGNIGEAVYQEESLCEVETVKEITYAGERVSAGGGCEFAATARKRCWWTKPRECGELLHGRRFPLKPRIK